MNAQVQAITDALKLDDNRNLHEEIVVVSQRLRKALDKVTTCVTDREAKYAKIKTLRTEMDTAMDQMTEGTEPERPVTKIAADIKRVNDSIDKEIDKVYDLISEADELRTQLGGLCQQIAGVPLAATAA